jgi:arylsulfatase A-like enzyme
MSRRLLALLLLAPVALFPALAKAAGKPNIVLITLDSARADRMGFMGTGTKLTPGLDGVAQQGVIFDRAYAQAPLTLASHATILSGTYPQTHRASPFGSPFGSRLPYLPDLLHARGYRTAAFVGSIQLDPRNGPAQGLDRGFDAYDAGFHQPQRGQDRYLSVERPGAQVAARALKWLADKSHRPFFLWVHLNDPHAPYGTSYNRAVAAADAAASKLIAYLRSEKLYDDALLVVAADHGESLGAHGETTHGIFLYDETIHVPLVVKLPQNQMGGRHIKGRVRLLDIAPTVLQVAGVPVPSQMEGQSLLRIAQTNPQSDQPAYARSDLPQQGFGCSPLESWRAGKYLYIRAPRPELYDLSADPGATRNLAQKSKATLETLAGQLAAFSNHFGQGTDKVSDAGLTDSEMQKLASLGYVGLQKSGAGVKAASEGTDPKDIIATANKTLAALRTLDDGKPDQAAPALQQVVTSQAKTYLAQYGLGAALAQQQRYADAVKHLHKAIELQPDSGFAHYEMGLSLIKTGDFKSAALHLEIASRRLPEFADLHSALAQAYERLGRGEDAKRERGRAAQLAPKS